MIQSSAYLNVTSHTHSFFLHRITPPSLLLLLSPSIPTLSLFSLQSLPLPTRPFLSYWSILLHHLTSQRPPSINISNQQRHTLKSTYVRLPLIPHPLFPYHNTISTHSPFPLRSAFLHTKEITDPPSASLFWHRSSDPSCREPSCRCTYRKPSEKMDTSILQLEGLTEAFWGDRWSVDEWVI